MSEERVELSGSASQNGMFRVRLDIELPHEQALQILNTVKSYKAALKREAETSAAQRAGDAQKAAALAKQSAKAESAKASGVER